MNEVQDSAKERGHALGTFAHFFRWLSCWRVMRRGLFVLACLVTLTGLVYAVENWRGKRAWEKCRRELEAKGEVLDWNAYIPAPVPDDQNVFKAPKIAEWFVTDFQSMWGPGKSSERSITEAPFRLAPRADAKKAPVLLAEVEVVPPAGPLPSGRADAVLRFDDPAAREQAVKFLNDITGPSTEGARAELIVARPRDQVQPLRLVVQADALPTVAALTEFLSHNPGPSQVGAAPRRSAWEVERVGASGFHVSLNPSVYDAAEFLALSQSAVPDFDVLRKALERPCARMDGDYERPFVRPVPNFVRLRTVAQMLSQRAQCYLLLGRPEAAWHELALVRDVCRLLGEPPAGKGTLLVEVMIDSAISGLYVGIIQDGLRLQAWREPELAAMQKQLQDINLLPALREAFNAERAASCRMFETTPPAELVKLFSFGDERRGLWDRLNDPRFLLIRFAPRGWLYQNMCVGAFREQLFVSSLDIPNNQVRPRVADGISNHLQTALSHFTPYTFLGKAATPNFLKATQTLGRNQILANEAFIACGLERYRLAHGQYPDTLDPLVPQFAEKVPHDIVGGLPLKYHRTTDGHFVLYSVGWNEKDDGGVSGKTTVEGDWVWQ